MPLADRPPEKPQRVERKYRDGTTILETSFHMRQGRVTLIDFLAPTRGSGATLVSWARSRPFRTS
jgi:hypothetical protein